MPYYGRHSVLSGQTIDLRVIFRDDANCLVDPDAVPDVYIYDESVDDDTIAAELEALTFTSALAGPLTPTQLSTGFYELSYTVPPGSNEGSWHDVWVATVDTVASNDILEFQVDTAAELEVQTLDDNFMVIINLDASISNLSNTQTLVEDQQLYFATMYNPYFASVDLVRAEVGTFIDYIPDNTIALNIHWSSKEAMYITPPHVCDRKYLDFARTKFVVYDAAIRAVLMPGGSSGSGAGTTSGGKKQLGDLLIDAGGGSGSSVATTSGGVDVETLGRWADIRDEWWRVVNSGACIVPGQSFDPETAIKGKYDPDRRASGRLWANPEYYSYSQPTANAKFKFRGMNRGRFGFDNNRRFRTRRNNFSTDRRF